MVAKRIIPCLDVKDGRVVKGINFNGLQDAGDPVRMGSEYSTLGADELVFLDITASLQARKTRRDWAGAVAKELDIPFTVGGGVESIKDIEALLKSGADKVGINSAAVANPALIRKAADEFGSQCIVVAIDAKLENGKYAVYVKGGRMKTDLDAIDWACRCAQLGAGEILLTSIDRDGTKNGFDIGLTKEVSKKVGIPVIASGGAGKMADFLEVFEKGKADAALAASVFHYKEIGIWELKDYISRNGVEVRCKN